MVVIRTILVMVVKWFALGSMLSQRSRFDYVTVANLMGNYRFRSENIYMLCSECLPETEHITVILFLF